METASNNIPCSALTDALTALARNTSPRKYSAVKTIPRSQHTSYLTDTAEAVREVARKIGMFRNERRNRIDKRLHNIKKLQYRSNTS